MSSLARVEHAFAELGRYSESTRALLQRVLLAATQDPAIVAIAETASISDALRVLDQTLRALPVRGLHVCPVLPEFAQLSARLPEGGFTSREDVEAAEAYLHTLPRPLRERVVWVVTSAIPALMLSHASGGPSLELFVRLTKLALDDLPFLLHVLEGEAVEPFLGGTSSAPPQSASRMRASRLPRG